MSRKKEVPNLDDISPKDLEAFISLAPSGIAREYGVSHSKTSDVAYELHMYAMLVQGARASRLAGKIVQAERALKSAEAYYQRLPPSVKW